MASQLPTGYNPETSLLQGGNAPIVAVQGGGGSMEAGAGLPAGYNITQQVFAQEASQSSATLIPIRGGGDQKGGAEKSYANYTIEQYDPALSMIDIPELPSEAAVRQKLYDTYSSANNNLMREIEDLAVGPRTYARVDSSAPIFDRCPPPGSKRGLPLGFFQDVRKRIVVVDTPNPFIWVIPNLKGNVSMFLQYMNLIPKTPEGLIQPDHFVIFIESFFSVLPGKDLENQNLYYQFLLQKLKNMNNLYYINNLNDDFARIACNLLSSIYSAATNKMGKPLTAFFEPDILVFTGPKILFKNSELPVQKENNAIKLSALLKKPEFISRYKSFIITPARSPFDDLPANGDTDVPEDQRYFTFGLQSTIVKYIKFPSKSEILCPKGKTCQNFKGGYSLAPLTDEKKLETTGLYLLYVNKDKMPFLKEAGSTLTPEELATLAPPTAAATATTSLPKPPAVVAAAMAGPTSKPPVKSTLLAPPVVPVKPPIEEPFQAFEGAVKKATRRIEVNFQEFDVRIPYEPGVREDWQQAHFTEEEAKLLNSLQFTPTLLSDALGKQTWKSRVADFLESLVESDCFENTKLLTKRECSNSQQFIKQVYFALFNRRLGELYDATGTPKPETFADLLNILRSLGRIGPTTGMMSITKDQYTGDLLERFQVLKFNAATGEYTTDFADMTEETRKVLERMKLYRVKSVNVDEVTKALYAQFGLPVPSSGSSLPPSSPTTPLPSSPSTPPSSPTTPLPSSGSTKLPPPPPPSSPTTPLSSSESTTLLPPGDAGKAILGGSCPFVNNSNWCFLNSSIQLMNDIPELKEGFTSLTTKQIQDSHAIYLTEKTEDEIRTALTIFQTIFQQIQANTAKKALDFTTIPLPDKTPVYTKLIDLLTSKADKAYIAARDQAAKEGKAFVAKKIAFEYGKQSDADEFLLASFNFIFDSDLEFLRITKYLLALESFERLECEDPAKGIVESGNTLLRTLELKVMIGQDSKTSVMQYAKSLQEALAAYQKVEELTEGNKLLESCGNDGKEKKPAKTKTTTLRAFAFTKYVFIKVSRLSLDTLYKGPIEINKVLTINGVTFQPRGVILHMGGLRASGETGGHYVYYHYEKGEPSILYDDSSVTPLTGAAVANARIQITTGARVVLYERMTPIDTASLPKLVPTEEEVFQMKKPFFDAMLALPTSTATEITERADERERVTRSITLELLKRLRSLDSVKAGGGDASFDLEGGEVLDLGDPVQTGTRKRRKHSKRFTRRDATRGNHKK